MTIRVCVDDDLSQLHAIQLACPQAAQWRLEDYRQLLHDPLGLILIATIEDGNPPRVAGFAAFHRVMDEAELRNMAVDPAHRRMGIARSLLAEGFRILTGHDVARVFLEVRASNQPAIEFYRSAGFQPMSTRRDYYHDPREDALMMACTLAIQPSPSPKAT
jgi:[ribosomal protein S18]-alanine N-acetyltransferase